MLEAEIIGTLVATVIFISLVYLLRVFLSRKFRQETKKILYLVVVLLSAAYLGYVAYLWRLFEFVVGVLATAGALGLLLALSLVPYVSDIFAGISIVLDPRINVGSEVEIDGKRGKIIEITLTRTVISGDECLIIVPNKKFRDSVVTVYSTKPVERLFKS
ncbi:MAG: mechanosensitive ion channel [Candidatus Caldarchaeum sp.]|nr:mechanosensitive ion channel family protein [Candidatus Caldarchaeum sp.]MDW8062870.1 mechanosensitive ion channel [Candidatus Caldarchaeum sp.]